VAIWTRQRKSLSPTDNTLITESLSNYGLENEEKRPSTTPRLPDPLAIHPKQPHIYLLINDYPLVQLSLGFIDNTTFYQKLK